MKTTHWIYRVLSIFMLFSMLLNTVAPAFALDLQSGRQETVKQPTFQPSYESLLSPDPLGLMLGSAPVEETSLADLSDPTNSFLLLDRPSTLQPFTSSPSNSLLSGQQNVNSYQIDSFERILSQAQEQSTRANSFSLIDWWNGLWTRPATKSETASLNTETSVISQAIDFAPQTSSDQIENEFKTVNSTDADQFAYGYDNPEGLAELKLVAQYPMKSITVTGINQYNNTAEYDIEFSADDSKIEYKIADWWWRFKWFCDFWDFCGIWGDYPPTSVSVWVRYIDNHLEAKNCSAPNIGEQQKLVVCELGYIGDDPGVPPNNWVVGDIVGLCSGTHIYEGPGENYPYHTIVPENDWKVKIIDGPENVDDETWWDTSRFEAGDPSGGTGWVMQSEAESCPGSDGEVVDRIKPVIVPIEIWPDGKGGLSVVVKITDNSGQILLASMSGGPGSLTAPLVARPEFGDDLYAGAFTNIPQGAILNFTITAVDPSNNKQTFNGSSQAKLGGQFGLSRCKNPCGNNTDASKGDPVTIGSLNFVQVLSAMQLAGPGGSGIDFTIVYNAQNSSSSNFGQGWSGPYQSSLTVRNNMLLRGVEIVYPDGQIVLFSGQTDGPFSPATLGNHDSLNKDGDSYVLTRSSGQQYVFNLDGLLTVLRDSNGNEIRLDYQNGKLIHLENDGGRWVNLSYDGDKVVALDGPEDKHVEFGYDGPILASFKDLRGQTWRFEYQSKNWGSLLDVNGQPYEAVDYWMSKIITPKGHPSVQNIYNEKGEVIEQWTGGREHLKFNRDEDSHNVTVRDAYDRPTKYSYDEQWRLERIDYPDGSHESFGYDERSNRIFMRDRNEGEWRYVYDERGNRLSEDGPLGFHREWEYHPDFNKPILAAEKVNASTNRTWMFEYDDQGNLVSICNPYDCSSITYNERGLPETITDFAENITTNTYDAEWDLATTSNGENETTIFDTDNAGRVISITSPMGKTFNFTFDAGDKLTDINGPLEYHVGFEFDENGNPATEVDANGGRTTYTFDTSDKLVTITNQNNIAIAAYEYGAMNEALVFVDGEGRRWNYDYDSNLYMIRMHGPLDVHITFKRDLMGNIILTTDAEGRTTRMAYDSLGRLTEVVENPQRSNSVRHLSSENITTKFDYNLVGDLLRVVDPEGNPSTYEFDLLSRITLMRDAKGQETRLEYNQIGNVIRQTNPRNFSTRFTYDHANRLKTVEDALGFTTTYDYDLNGRLRDVNNPLSVTTRFEYDDLGRQIAVIQNYKAGQTSNYETNVTTHYQYDLAGNLIGVLDPSGYQASYIYDPAFRLTDIYDFENGHTQNTYDNVNNILSVTDPNGHETTYQVDALDRVTGITNPEGHSVSFTYNKTGALTRIVDANGNSTTFTLDALDRVTSMVDAMDGQWNYRYDRVGNILEERDANGHTTLFTYDKIYRLLSTKDAEGNITHFEWDPNSNLTKLVDGNQNPTTFLYDAVDQLISTTNAENETTQYDYDALGYQTKLVEADNTVTRYEYDPLYRLTSVTENYKNGQSAYADTNVVTRYIYDASSNLVQFVNANKKITQFEYDGMGRILREVNPLGNAWTFDYDPAGNLIRRVDANGKQTDYAYYDDDQLQSARYWDNSSVEYKYDNNNNLSVMTDRLGTTFWDYDALDRVAKVTDSLTRTLKVDYDAVGNRTSLTYPDGNKVAYTYYANNRLKSMTSPGGTTNYTRDGVGNITLVQNPNFTQSSIAYDKANRTISLVNEQMVGASKTNSAFEYAYNKVGHVTSVKATYASQQITQGSARESKLEVTETYGYDGLHRLISAKRDGVNNQATEKSGWQMDYEYDAVGNRTKWQANDNPATQAPKDGFTAAYQYNAANQLVSASIVADKRADSVKTTYKYDQNGNRIEKLVAPQSGHKAGTVYEYDPENRLLKAQDFQVGGRDARIYRAITTLDYDGMGRRLVQTYDPKTGSGGAKQAEYTFDGLDPVSEYSMWNGQRDNFYRGAMGRISLMQSFPSGTAGQMYWYDYNFKGDVVGLSKQSGQSIHNYQYDPYGSVLPETGNFTDPHNHYTLTGKEYDENTGLVYFGARHYDPQSAQWMTQDSYRGTTPNPFSLHRYNYLYSNPVSYYDAYGHEPLTLAAVWLVVKVVSAVVDYGWTIWDAGDSALKIAFSNDEEEKTFAKLNLLLCTTEFAEPDEFSPINLPIDDIARKSFLKYLKEKGFKEAIDMVRKEYGDEVADTILDASKGKIKNEAKEEVVETVIKNGLSKPTVTDSALSNLVNDLYRPGAKIGNGSTADAIRHELKTGELVGGKSHIQKGQDYINALQNWLQKHPNASQSDIDAAKAILTDLQNALGGN